MHSAVARLAPLVIRSIGCGHVLLKSGGIQMSSADVSELTALRVCIGWTSRGQELMAPPGRRMAQDV